tara:strand:+ start:1040 stop:1921 length:882 start_codon:yes stop_codon:yes gene_type:complete
MLESLAKATNLPYSEVEILCSWNGTKASEANIVNRSGYEFLVAQRDPYHFASNMNQLAQNANGDVLAIVNDDLILDQGSLDAGLTCLLNDISTLCVGALLRTSNGNLQHGGMAFDSQNTPYHIAEGCGSVATTIGGLAPFEVPCVTGALMLIRRSTFSKHPFEESYQRCGEDVQLNLDLREKLKGKVMLCPGMSGIHIESATRSENNETGNTSEDLVKMRTRRRLFLEKASSEMLKAELLMAGKEHTWTQGKASLNANGMSLTQERDYWKREAQTLQLELLRMKDLIQRHEEA